MANVVKQYFIGCSSSFRSRCLLNSRSVTSPTSRGSETSLTALTENGWFIKLFSKSMATSTSTKEGKEEEDVSDSEYLSSETEDSGINISGLDPDHLRQYNGEAPVLPYKDLRMRRKLFTRFGLRSGEDPRIMWPTRSEMIQAEVEEKEEAMSLQQRLNDLQSQRDLEQKQRIARHKTIEKNMAQMPETIAKYRARLKKAEDVVKERRQKKDELLEEAREHFGYKISEYDPKFEEMMEERREKQKKEERIRKREEKAKKMKAKLLEEARKMGMNMEDLGEKDNKKS